MEIIILHKNAIITKKNFLQYPIVLQNNFHKKKKVFIK